MGCILGEGRRVTLQIVHTFSLVCPVQLFMITLRMCDIFLLSTILDIYPIKITLFITI